MPLGGLLSGLIDTGAILAILESDDEWHLPCVEALGSVRFPLLTTEAVLTELFHLVGSNPRKVAQAWDFLRSGSIALRAINDPDLPSLRALMAQYADRPMDFADATLVHVAAREFISVILTVDRDDFETYRLPRNKKFDILPRRL